MIEGLDSEYNQSETMYCENYDNYKQLANSNSDISNIVKTCLYRIGQTQELIPLNVLKSINYKDCVPLDQETKKECLNLINQLDSNDYRIRQKAILELQDIRFLPHIKLLSQNINLSIDQKEAINSILNKYTIYIPPEVRRKLFQ